jgi:hypothetical protein
MLIDEMYASNLFLDEWREQSIEELIAITFKIMENTLCIGGDHGNSYHTRLKAKSIWYGFG